jgi:hypothetical protein
MFLPFEVREVYFLYKDIFEEQNIGYLHATSLMLLHSAGYKDLSDLVRFCPTTPSVSGLADQLLKFNKNRFMKRNQKRILDMMNRSGHCEFCFAIDDTANPKYGNCFQSDKFGSSSGVYFGQKVMVLVVVNLRTGRAYPIQFTFLTGKNNPDHIPANVIAIHLLQEAIHYGFPPCPVTSDSWFDSKDFIKSVINLGCDFAGELKSTRNVKNNPSPNSPVRKLTTWFNDLTRQRLPQTKFQKRLEKRGKAFSEDNLYITDLGYPLKVIAVYNRMNGNSPFAYYATTNLSMTGSKLWKMSRARWAIEVMFRDLKQFLSFGRLSAGGEGGANLSICIPLILFTSMRIDSKRIWNCSEQDSIGSIVKGVREVALSKSLDHIIHQPNGEKIKILKARRKNPTQKPTNICGENKSA